MILWKKHTSLRDSDMPNICCRGQKEESGHLATPCRLPLQQLVSLSRGQGALCQTKLWQQTPQLPAILVCSISEPIFEQTDLQNTTIPILKIPFLKTNKKRTRKQDECFWLKEQKHSPITREEFFSQYVPNEKSVASLLVASHTSSHAAHTTSCTRLSPGEIQLQN